MLEFKPITFTEEYTQKYWEGPTNRFARYYIYLQRGFGLVNEAKNYAFIIFGSVLTVEFVDFFGYKISSWWIIVAGIIGIPILLLAGRWDLFKLSKAREFATVQHGSVTRYDSYNMTVRMIEQQDEIIKLLETIKSKAI